MVPMQNKSHVSSYATAVACALIATSCAIHDTNVTYAADQLNRRVVDAADDVGLGGAIVVFQWDRRETDIGHGARTYCVRVELFQTDSDGHYSVPTWEGRYPMINVIYKRSYSRVNDPEAKARGIDKMTPYIGQSSGRLAEMERIYAPLNCPKSEDSRLVKLFEAMYEEAKSIARSPKDAEAVEGMRRILEAAKYGENEAGRRARDRLQQPSVKGE